MARKVKCPYCQGYLNKEEAHEYKKRYYHPDCFDKWQQEKLDRQELIKYVCEIYNLEAPTGLILKQIKEFHEEYSYTYKGMRLALEYFYEILENAYQEGQGIGIIPYIYEDAKRQYITKMKVAESVKNYKKEEPELVIVNSSQPTINHKKRNKKIDISSL